MSVWNKLLTSCKFNLQETNNKLNIGIDKTSIEKCLSYSSKRVEVQMNDCENDSMTHENVQVSNRHPVTRQMSVSRSGRYKQKQRKRSALFDIPELTTDKICYIEENKSSLDVIKCAEDVIKLADDKSDCIKQSSNDSLFMMEN